MNIPLKMLLAVALTSTFSSIPPAVAQDGPGTPPSASPAPNGPSDDILIFPTMPPSEPMFDAEDEMMMSQAPMPPGFVAAFEGPNTFTMRVPPPPGATEGPGDVLLAIDGPPRGPGGPGGPGCPVMRRFGHGPFGGLSGELALKDDQLEKLNVIKNQALDATGAQSANLMSYRRQLRDLLSAPTLDRTKITALQQKINDSQSAMSNARINALMASHDVLTDEQRKEVREQYLKGSPGLGGTSFGARFHTRHHGF